jgi:hypothetical protein
LSYEQSIFSLTRKIATENEDWSTDRIAARQNWMAKQAANIWPAAQLHHPTEE